MRKLLFLVSLCSIPACAESIFSVGVLGGAPFTDVVNHTNQPGYLFTAKSSNYSIGPAIQINLPLNLRFEFDALYRPYEFAATSNVPAPLAAGLAPSHVSSNQWNFPMLAQYRFKFPVVQPFVEAGVAVNHLANISYIGAHITSGAGNLIRQTNAGVVIGGGVDLKIPIVRLSGELRYTRQSQPYFANVSNLDQAEFLVGIHF
jgi:hypothetical protein